MSLHKPAELDDHGVKEEIVSSITHGIGALLAIAALAILVTFAARMGDPWRIVGFSVYGATLVLLYLASTFYHAFQNPKVKRVFRILDHAAIYLLIAGTYTPVLLVTLRGTLGWTLFGVTWGLAILGVVQASIWLDRLKIVALITYLAMGWLVVVALKPLATGLSAGGLIWLALGGLCYTGGVVFYVSKRIPFNHAIWHLFVLGGSICHFFFMLLYVLPK